MGIFSSIKNAIFGSAQAAGQPAAVEPDASVMPQSAAPEGVQSSSSTPSQAVDVAAILERAVVSKGQKLNWRTSIVDLMKALDLDSSLSARKELAQELSYTGDASDSATMNIWLHKALMQKLAENGGIVPDDLK